MNSAGSIQEYVDKIESLLEDLCFLLAEFDYSDNSRDIIIQETEIFEYAQDYIPKIDPELNDFFNYIHQVLRGDDFLEEREIEAHIFQIHERLRKLTEFPKIPQFYSDEMSKHSPSVSTDPFLQEKGRNSIQSQLDALLDQPYLGYDEETNEIVSLSNADRKALAIEKRNQRTYNVIEYLRKYPKPITYAQILREVPKTTYQILDLASRSTAVVHFDQRLLHAGHLASLITAEQRKTLLQDLQDTFILDQKHSSQQIYLSLIKKYSDFFRTIDVQSPYDLFSLIAVLYPHEFVYSRPTIGLPGQVLSRPVETIQNYLNGRYKTAISDLQEYIETLDYDLTCGLKLFKALKQSLLSDRNTIVPITRFEMTEEQLLDFVFMIRQELLSRQEDYEALPIRELECVANFPPCGISWTEWLIYSVLDKIDWPAKEGENALFVHTTSPTFSRAIPLVSLNPVISKETRMMLAEQHKGEIEEIKMDVDDLSNLDELIEDEINYDWDLDLLEEEEIDL